jgi:hypothetical protein
MSGDQSLKTNKANTSPAKDNARKPEMQAAAEARWI